MRILYLAHMSYVSDDDVYDDDDAASRVVFVFAQLSLDTSMLQTLGREVFLVSIDRKGHHHHCHPIDGHLDPNLSTHPTRQTGLPSSLVIIQRTSPTTSISKASTIQDTRQHCASSGERRHRGHRQQQPECATFTLDAPTTSSSVLIFFTYLRQSSTEVFHGMALHSIHFMIDYFSECLCADRLSPWTRQHRRHEEVCIKFKMGSCVKINILLASDDLWPLRWTAPWAPGYHRLFTYTWADKRLATNDCSSSDRWGQWHLSHDTPRVVTLMNQFSAPRVQLLVSYWQPEERWVTNGCFWLPMTSCDLWDQWHYTRVNLPLWTNFQLL